MKKNLLLFCFFALSLSGLWGRSVADCFKEMPLRLLPSLNQAMRLDLIDFFESGKPLPMLGVLGEELELKIMTDDYLFLQTSTQSDVQLKLLPDTTGNSILAVVHTVHAPAAGSALSFYTLDWQAIARLQAPRLSSSYFLNTDCLRQKSGKQDLSIAELSSLFFYEFKFQAGNDFLQVYTSIPDFLGEKALGAYRDCLNQRVVFQWTGSGFVY